ncbi:GAF domain-containing protein [uncultured Tateyamaria sp.]|uniref:GAF domain-containing protein n=1 Tax=uncultured Tateyamaria sp. TaxID=455651 RepID=UPI002606774D|nr:GAF domain-containing protein [uncultured Tateyamaria sp.]
MSDAAQIVETLSKREAEVAAAYADGASYKIIARELGISPTTVRSHLRTVYGKLNVTSKIALAQALADPHASSTEDQNTTGLLADLALELDEAIRRERAMTRVLRIINDSSGNLDEVIDEVLEQALEICEAEFGILMEHHGNFTFTEMRSSNISAPFSDWLSTQGAFNPGADTAVGRAARSLKPISVVDVNADEVSYEDNPLRFATVKFGHARSLAAIPMTAGGRLIGVFSVYRTRVHPFNDRALELAQAFADQAAIAIENSLHIKEMETRLDRSAASREILDAISTSSDDEGPVFDAILRNAAKLCNSPMARLELADSARQNHYCAAAWGDKMRSFKIGEVLPLDQPNDLPTAIREGVVRHVHDLSKSDLYLSGNPTRVRMVEEEGYHTYLCVPLIAAGRGIGAIVLSRREVAPFSDESIALVENLAKQAVIAIENVRRFRALRDRLDRAAATREILEAISNASDDEGPVFDAILGNARKLCDAPFAALILGRAADEIQTMIAHHGALQSTEDFYSQGKVPMDPDQSFAARAIIEKRPVHLHNMMDTEQYRAGVPNVVELCDVQGIRTNLFVPLIRDGEGIGCFIIFRHEVRPYSDEQIALVETFATQAVIALENVRRFREVETRLKREKASSDILTMISQSRDDEAPVFDLILRTAADLCSAHAAALAMGQVGDKHQTMEASYGLDAATVKVYDDGLVSMDPDQSVGARAIVSQETVHIHDMAETDAYKSGVTVFVSVVEETGIRSNLLVPLITSEGAIGVLILFRKVVKPYTPDEIALVETFAAQAVIAIENARQFRALQARTSEVQELNASLEAKVDEQVVEIERIGRLKRFLPSAVADTVVSSGSEQMLQSHRALLGVLFCDIRGFTAFCETAEPEETIEVLQTYHEEMGKLINQHGAGVDLRMGDGIMVLFNDPIPCDDPAGDAVRLAIAMRARMVELCTVWKRLGHRLGFGVGVSLGYATVGLVGFEGRFDYTASGTAINLASRLCDEADDGEILLSTRAGIAVEDTFKVETRGELSLKGIREPIEVFRLASDV